MNIKKIYEITEKNMREIFTDQRKLKELDDFIGEIAEIFINDGGGCDYLEDKYGSNFTEEQLKSYIPEWVQETLQNIENEDEEDWCAAESLIKEYQEA